ncbi:major facilitator superfamily domain-containing protein [Suillus bovinus]|uniref:major facilitator superfamily domain-containing protein n=1 Tax=Suillus bovinus TaxID=48563 RepID=UPI001B87ADBC|nr:major facilitator superfamily domain-containing protein [Suillus bovinus]KAG2134047.1 major facilitator superfamily domain-containing protein [Suillus bovinus]
MPSTSDHDVPHALEPVDTEKPPPPPPPFVEGGLRGYMTIFGAFFALFAAFGQSMAFGSFQLWYSQNQLVEYTASDISWIGSVQLWVFFVSGGVVGRLFDAYGPTWLLASGTIILTFSLMMTSLATKYYEFILAQGIVFGIGFGLLFFPSMSATATHFMKYRATALGIAVAGSSVGGVVFPIMLQQLFDKVGFGWAVRISAFVCLACGVIATALVSSRLPKRKPGPWIDVSSLKDVNYAIFVLGSAVTCLGIFVPMYYIVQYAQEYHISQSLAFGVLSIMNAGSVFGRIAPSIMADRIGRFNTLIPSTALMGIFTLALWLHAHDLATITTYSVFYGFFSGSWFAMQTSCIAQISRMDKIGVRMGMAYSLVSFPALVGEPIAGAILTRDNASYTGMIVFTGVSLLLGSLITLVVKLRINRSLLAKV